MFTGFLVVGLILMEVTMAMDGRCSNSNCKLPDCHCPGHGIPGGYQPEEIPQMVLITFDDAVNWDNWEFYLRLFPPDGSRKNPNGCPIGATFFVSHNFTDYCMVRKLHARGQEIADHSLSHRLPHAWWEEATNMQLAHEILTQRKNIADLAEIPITDIKGWRSPFLQPSGDHQFEVLYQNNFTYDATLTYPFPRNVYSPVMWPFTLDFSYPLVCNIQPCPQKTYPGFWVVPVVVMMDYREHLPCAYVDHCTNEPRNHDETFDMLWKNFLRNYRTNRAPMYVNLHSIWLETDFHLDAMDEFIQRLLTMEDVFIVPVYKVCVVLWCVSALTGNGKTTTTTMIMTMKPTTTAMMTTTTTTMMMMMMMMMIVYFQALDWMKDPTPMSSIKDFKPWLCDYEPNQEDKAFCSFTFRPLTTTTTKRPSTTPHRHYHNTDIGQRDDDYEQYDDDRDHNGFDRDGRRKTHGNLHDEGSHRGRKHHVHRPWFLRNGAGFQIVRRLELIPRG
nr:hypothetical protein BaRGS_012151 [Batillaria attramentaria]